MSGSLNRQTIGLPQLTSRSKAAEIVYSFKSLLIITVEKPVILSSQFPESDLWSFVLITFRGRVGLDNLNNIWVRLVFAARDSIICDSLAD